MSNQDGKVQARCYYLAKSTGLPFSVHTVNIFVVIMMEETGILDLTAAGEACLPSRS